MRSDAAVRVAREAYRGPIDIVGSGQVVDIARLADAAGAVVGPLQHAGI